MAPFDLQKGQTDVVFGEIGAKRRPGLLLWESLGSAILDF